MSISKPYYRIIRPTKESLDGYFGTADGNSYVVDKKYAQNRIELCRGCALLEKSLMQIFDYIEPAKKNLKTFSHRIYELQLRACTEFETNAKYILEANNYRSNNHLNITDYYKINKASRLCEYEIMYENWRGGHFVFQPFKSWSKSHTLKWYQDYNTVKHNRDQKFELANLENTIHAVGGVVAILFSQFGISTNISPQLELTFREDGFIRPLHCNFAIKPPTGWGSSDYYDFDWEKLKDQTGSIQAFNFI